jgi:hypothetical protein
MFVNHFPGLNAVRSNGAIIRPLRLRISPIREPDRTTVGRHKNILLLETEPEFGLALTIDTASRVRFVRCSISMENLTQHKVGALFEGIGIDPDWLKDAVRVVPFRLLSRTAVEAPLRSIFYGSIVRTVRMDLSLRPYIRDVVAIQPNVIKASVPHGLSLQS